MQDTSGLWTSTDRRIGLWSALAVVFLALAYVLTGALGLISRGGISLDYLPPEPHLTICRSLMVLAVMAMVVLFASIHAFAPSDRKTFSLAALAFLIILVTLTSSVNFLLIVVRQESEGMRGPAWPITGHFPSVLLALDLLAWGPFAGLALLFASMVFRGGGLQTATRLCLAVGGLMCAADVLCPALGRPGLCWLGVIGYDFVFPVGCVLMAILFRRSLISASIRPIRS
jgi:hypothetical protein